MSYSAKQNLRTNVPDNTDETLKDKSFFSSSRSEHATNETTAIVTPIVVIVVAVLLYIMYNVYRKKINIVRAIF